MQGITYHPTELLIYGDDKEHPIAVATRKGGDGWRIFPEPGQDVPAELLRDPVLDDYGNVVVKANSFTWEELQAILEAV